MTQLLRLSDGAWPRSRADLQLAYPLTAFPADLSQCDLSDFDHVIPTPANPPPHNPATQRVEEAHPVLVDGTWRQAWQVIDLPPPPPLPSTPDWNRFRGQLQTSNGFPAAWLQAFQANPQVAGLLGPRLDLYQVSEAEKGYGRGSPTLFLEALAAALQLLAPAQRAEIAVEFVALATLCNMPAPFLVALEAMLEDLG